MGEPLHGDGDGGRRAWLGPASCAIAVLTFIGFYSTTTVHFDFHYGDDGSGFGFNFASGMEWWYHVTLVLLFAAGSVAGVLGRKTRGPERYFGWVGAVLNAVCGLLLALFLVAAYIQKALS